MERIVTSVDRVERIKGKPLFFISVHRLPEDDPDVQSHGVSFSQFRTPEKFFHQAKNRSFPHVAELELVPNKYGDRLNVFNYRFVKEIA